MHFSCLGKPLLSAIALMCCFNLFAQDVCHEQVKRIQKRIKGNFCEANEKNGSGQHFLIFSANEKLDTNGCIFSSLKLPRKKIQFYKCDSLIYEIRYVDESQIVDCSDLQVYYFEGLNKDVLFFFLITSRNKRISLSPLKIYAYTEGGEFYKKHLFSQNSIEEWSKTNQHEILENDQ